MKKRLSFLCAVFPDRIHLFFFVCAAVISLGILSGIFISLQVSSASEFSEQFSGLLRLYSAGRDAVSFFPLFFRLALPFFLLFLCALSFGGFVFSPVVCFLRAVVFGFSSGLAVRMYGSLRRALDLLGPGAFCSFPFLAFFGAVASTYAFSVSAHSLDSGRSSSMRISSLLMTFLVCMAFCLLLAFVDWLILPGVSG